MKQFVTLVCLTLFSVAAVQAQSFKFADPPTQIIDVPELGTDSTGEFSINFLITNTGDSPLKLMAYRDASHSPGHESYFCWDLCYPPFTDSCQTAVEVGGGDTTGYGRYLTFLPNEIPGYTEITIIVADSITGESISHTYKLSVGGALSVEDKFAAAASLSNPFPNPASEETSVKVQFPSGIQKGTVEVFNLIGKKVLSRPVNQPNETVTFSVKELNSGIYFVYLVGEGKELTSRKLVVVK
ncbi:MAG: T9SS type A sorting domain-containing protein [Bacteroidota bacterium]